MQCSQVQFYKNALSKLQPIQLFIPHLPLFLNSISYIKKLSFFQFTICTFIFKLQLNEGNIL